ncbi:putative DNA-binding transcriptional regulator YafY [Actinoalloteichus hoggarensis]|nr:YafY family protein [Actinoalloteichus hoggarensis]MBB5923525.1 putative DNA-binding transcriptional regulator YafY [Actinoalloteichus hoggarensis]
MSSTSGRLLRLLSLLQTPREWPGGELAERLRVSRRTVRRDIDRLRELGYPVEAARGPIGGYRLRAGQAMPPLLLDDEEAVAIAVGIRLATGHPVTGIEEASLRALAKVAQVLPSRLRQRVDTLGSATVPMTMGGGASVSPEVLAVIAGAVIAGERLRFGYASADGRTGRRLVEPYRLVAAERRWYLPAFDVERDDWRIFRVDRIDDAARTGVRVPPREPPIRDAAEFVTSRFFSLAPVYEMVATLRLPAAEAVRRLGADPAEVTAIDDTSCVVRGHADTVEWLAARLLLADCEFEVHAPEELRARLRGWSRRAGRAADDD